MVDETKVRQCLGNLQYPARFETIIQTAQQNNCRGEVLSELSRLPSQEYSSADDVVGRVGSRPGRAYAGSGSRGPSGGGSGGSGRSLSGAYSGRSSGVGGGAYGPYGGPGGAAGTSRERSGQGGSGRGR